MTRKKGKGKQAGGGDEAATSAKETPPVQQKQEQSTPATQPSEAQQGPQQKGKKGKGKQVGGGDEASTSSKETPPAQQKQEQLIPATHQKGTEHDPQHSVTQQSGVQQGPQQKGKKGKKGKGPEQHAPQPTPDRGQQQQQSPPQPQPTPAWGQQQQQSQLQPQPTPAWGQQQRPQYPPPQGLPPGFSQQGLPPGFSQQGGGGDGAPLQQPRGSGVGPRQQYQQPSGVGAPPQQQQPYGKGQGAFPKHPQQPRDFGVPSQQPQSQYVPQQQPQYQQQQLQFQQQQLQFQQQQLQYQQQPQYQQQQPQYQQQQPQGRGASPQHQQPQGRGTSPRHQQPQSPGAPPQGQQPRGAGAPAQQQPKGRGASPQHQHQQPQGPGAPRSQQQQPQGPGAPQSQQKQPQGRGTQQQQPQGPGAPRQQPRGPAAPTTQLSQLSIGNGDIKPMEFKKYPPGVKGRKIQIETNHLQLMLGKLTIAIHYDVQITPDTPKKYLRTVMELFRQQHYPKRWPAFDGRKNLYSSSMLPFGEAKEGEVILRETDGREKKYKVAVKYANDVDLSPLRNFELSRATPREALQVVDIVLRSAPAKSLISVGQSFFIKPQQIIDLGEGMEMYHGFYQSAIRGWKPFLNVDVAHKAFPKGMQLVDALIDVVSSNYNQLTRESLARPLDRRDVDTFAKFIRTLRVIYEIPGIPSSRRAYRVNGLQESAGTKTFTLDNGPQITIERYFAEQKRYRLRYPTLPTIWVGDKNRPNPILLPMELCRLEENQVVNRKMTENQTSKMIRSAATDTNTRKNKINNGIREANYNNDPSVKEFGFSVSNVFEKLDARVLSPPVIGYANRKVSPSRGVWRNDKFFKGAVINAWTIVAADRRPPRPDDFARLEDSLFRNAQPCGLIMNSRAEKPFQTIGDRLADIKKYFQNQKGKYDVIFVIVPNSGPQYSYVKSAAEINVGCLTQCVKSRTVFKMNPQTATNILLKVNAKLNGTNHFLDTRPGIMNRPTMIMGADVTHPGPDSTEIPSVAAVTASHDPKAFKYNICWRLQPPRQEIIDDLENITLEHLKFFFNQNNGMKPERIIFFRDGVSEGQFEEVRRAEIRAIRAACKRIQADGYQPAITFLVVQKRHHTRLFPLNPRDSEDKNNNVPAGTCVDYHITHPFMQDFYLVSHASIQGVAKPTKYCTLWDDNDLSNDDLEELTYFLCHMFTRCNRSVSYPAPTYYAHLAAARAKVYIENDRIDLDNLRREYEKYQIQDVIRKDKPMFFV